MHVCMCVYVCVDVCSTCECVSMCLSRLSMPSPCASPLVSLRSTLQGLQARAVRMAIQAMVQRGELEFRRQRKHIRRGR
jgi:MCM5, C-terminal domain